MTEAWNTAELGTVLERHDEALREARSRLLSLTDALLHEGESTTLLKAAAARRLEAEDAAARTALTLAHEVSLAPEVRAITALTYGQRELLQRQGDNPYLDAAIARLTILNEALSFAGSGEPLLFIDGGYDGDEADFVAATLATDSLVYVLPTDRNHKPRDRYIFTDGFVRLRSEYAAVGIADRYQAVLSHQKVIMKPSNGVSIHVAGPVMDGHYSIDPLEYGLHRGTLVAGEAAIRTKTASMHPGERLVASTVLDALGFTNVVSGTLDK